MRFGCVTPNTATTAFGPSLIAAGLATLLLQACWPSLPVATSLALVALGTTIETVCGRRRTANRPGVIAVHFFVYTSLYLLFIGAICDASMRGTYGGLPPIVLIDLILSAGVMVLAARLCVLSIVAGLDSPVG